VLLASASNQLRQQWNPAIAVVGIVQPAVFLLVLLFARGGADTIDVAEAALGVGLLALWGVTVWQAGGVLRHEKRMGTLSQILVRPSRFAAVLVGKCLGATVRAVLFIAPTVAVIALLAGDPIVIERPGVFALAGGAVVLSAGVTGVLFCCLFFLSRAPTRIAEALTYPVFILGGMVVPLALLPEWARYLSTLVPLRWGSELLRAAVSGDPLDPQAWMWLALTTAAYAVVALSLFTRMVDRGRKEGTLEFF
jgi:ABC-2 type transport system permease protein